MRRTERCARAVTTVPEHATVTTISQRQLRNDSGDVLRRAAAGEVFRIRSGETRVELRRATPDRLDALTAAGLLTPSSDDDLADREIPAGNGRSVDEVLAESRGDR